MKTIGGESPDQHAHHGKRVVGSKASHSCDLYLDLDTILGRTHGVHPKWF